MSLHVVPSGDTLNFRSVFSSLKLRGHFSQDQFLLFSVLDTYSLRLAKSRPHEVLSESWGAILSRTMDFFESLIYRPVGQFLQMESALSLLVLMATRCWLSLLEKSY